MSGMPADWPQELPPPRAEDWQREAVAWMFDLVPPEYRQYDVLRRHPLLLARFAAGHLEASLEAARRSWRSLRGELSGRLPTEVIEQAMAAYEREGSRLADARRALGAVQHALLEELGFPKHHRDRP